jgi:hypothetical protein
MDASETHAEKYLRSKFASVVFEPDGNVPPDFLGDGRVAVEVRRLNQQENSTGEYRGLEETAIPLWDNLRRLLTDLGPPKDKSWFVFFDFSRPVETWKTLKPLVRNQLIAFRDGPEHKRSQFQITSTYRLDVFPASTIHPTFFLLGGCSDDDSGGLVLREIEKSMKLCIAEKTRKIAPVRHKYSEWWLVLIDQVGFGLDDFDRKCFKDQVKVEHSWNKVVLLNPWNHTRALEI